MIKKEEKNELDVGGESAGLQGIVERELQNKQFIDLTDKLTPYNKSTTEEEITKKLVNQRMIKKEEKNELDVGGESAGLQGIVERELQNKQFIDLTDKLTPYNKSTTEEEITKNLVNQRMIKKEEKNELDVGGESAGLQGIVERELQNKQFIDLTDKLTPYNKSTTEEEITKKLVNQRMIKKEEKNELDVGGESAGLQGIVERELQNKQFIDLTDKLTPYNKSTTEEEITKKLVNQRIIKKEEKNELDVGGESGGLQRIVEREREFQKDFLITITT